jgi:regulator of sirC expression with transglutaminase-like and TPR domain
MIAAASYAPPTRPSKVSYTFAMHAEELRQPFADAVRGQDDRLDLALACLLIARLEYPELNIASYVGRLDAMGDELSRRLSPVADPFGRLDALREYLFEQEGFHGNSTEYYDPRNSFLNDVLDRHTGIPITLSALFMEVGRRAGIDVCGVGLPGHFIVRVEHADGSVLVDPFHGGTILTEEDCQHRLDRVYGGRIRLRREHLASCTRRQILARMLSNLKAIYSKSDDYERALRVMELLLIVTSDPEEVRDRGMMYAALDCYSLAVTDLTRYLARVPQAADAEMVRGTLEELRRKAARLN